MEVRPVQLTWAFTWTRSPTRTGSKNAISSMEAVTAGPPLCRPATAPAASSTSFMITPPCTVPRRFVSLWVMMWLSVVREAEVGLPGISAVSGSAAGAWSVMASTLCGRDICGLCVGFATAVT